MIHKLESACKVLHENGSTIVKASDVADQAGISDVSKVGSVLWTETDSNPENCKFEDIDLRLEGESEGSNDYRIRKL